MKARKTIFTVICATIAGLLAGMLFAPEKGSRTRRKIMEKGEDSLDDLKSNFKHSIRDLKKMMNTPCPESKASENKRGTPAADIVTR